MRRTFLKLLAFGGFNLVLISVWLYATSAYVKRNAFDNGNCDSNLFFMPRGEHFDLLLLGASRAREFSLHHNHARIERLLGQRVINLSRGNGAGIVPMEIYLSRFYDEGNSANVVIYLIDPFAFYSPDYNEDNSFINSEPFDLDFARRIVQRGAGMRGVLSYVQSKFRHTWILLKPDPTDIEAGTVTSRAPEAVAGRLANLYHQGRNEDLRRRYIAHLEEIVRMAKDHGSRMLFVIVPTLIGPEPGSADLLELLERLRAEYDTPYYDYSQALQEMSLYQNIDHLNTNGVVQFTTHFLKPLLKE